MLGGAGIDTASSAQSKRAGGGETARFGDVWGEQGCLGGNRGVDGEQGALAVVDSVVNNVVGV